MSEGLVPLELHLREYGRPRAGRPPVVLLHGLLGSGMNWHGLAQRLAEDVHVLVPDLRNHGRSPHHPLMGYEAMAVDVLAQLDCAGLDEAVFIGHSMGGKVAMWLALHAPERVGRLGVLDIAPVIYPNRFEAIMAGLQAIELETLDGREAADRTLADYVASPPVRQFLLANLVRSAQGWEWRMNLPALAASLPALLGFPPVQDRRYAGATLFVKGGRSDYITEQHWEHIRALFPQARLQTVEDAGHWLYAEQPERVRVLLRDFLAA